MLASTRSIVTVEEIVDELEPRPGRLVLPGLDGRRGRVAPGGAHPSYAHGYYDRDNGFYVGWDADRRDRDVALRARGWTTARARGGEHDEREPRYTADEMMAVEAARRLDDGTVCFVGIGLPEPRREPRAADARAATAS